MCCLAFMFCFLINYCVNGIFLLSVRVWHVKMKRHLWNIIFTLLIRDRRKMQISNIGFWESWRRSQSINRKRVWEQMGVALSGLLPWRDTLHAIEGKKGLKCNIAMTWWFYPNTCCCTMKISTLTDLFQAGLELGWRLTLFSSDIWFTWTYFTALSSRVSFWGLQHFMAGATAVVSQL